VLVTTNSVAKQLAVRNSVVWGRGVDTDLFHPSGKNRSGKKTIITVGRVSKDKNLDDFSKIRGYNKILIGDGSYLKPSNPTI
jgi:glycosyltransferase involved in cell wall biosynthesis